MIDTLSLLRKRSDAGSAAHSFLSVLMGAGFTFGLFWGVAHYARVAPRDPLPAIDDLHSVALPVQPPPPPRTTPPETEPALAPASVVDFEPGASDSPVKIGVVVPNLEALVPTPPQALPALLQVGSLRGEFKPRADAFLDAQRIFQQSEVDRIPTALYRPPPPISRRHFKDVDRIRITLLFVVEANGSITNVRVVKSSENPDVDAIVMDTVQNEWGFTPAIKRGRKVRCLMQQPFTIMLPSASKFHM
jgi:TonB family protein